MTDTDNDNVVGASSFANIVSFLIILLIYYFVMFVFDIHDGFLYQIGFVIFYLSVFYTQYLLNESNAYALCGSYQSNIALRATLFPWLVVFGTFIMLLMIFPGWTRCFANTFGYYMSMFSDSTKILNKILNDNIVKDTPLAKLYQGDPSYLINEIPLNKDSEGNWIFWYNTDSSTGMSDGIIKPSCIPRSVKDLNPESSPIRNPEILQFLNQNKDKLDLQENSRFYTKLYTSLKIREEMGFFMWYLLLGILCCLLSTQTILTVDCSKSLDSLEQDYNDEMNESANQSSSKDNNPKYKHGPYVESS